MTEYFTPPGAPQQQPSPPSPVTAPQPSKAAGRMRRKKREGWNNVVSTVAVLLLAPVIALFLTAFVFQSYQVDGQSMETTLEPNDRLIVWKMPKTWSRITGNNYIPSRGDVVIFVERALANYGQDPNKQLIKRVIALPGERVTVKNGVVTVYNDEHSNGFQPDKTLPYGKVIGTTSGEVDTVIPENSIFVLGDNRSNSLDSRNFGPVAAKDIIGKLILRVLPADNIQRF